MTYQGYECLRIRRERGVAFVTIDHPPINLFDLALIQEIDRVGRELAVDGDIRVVVFDSANPDFFIAHADVALIQHLPTTTSRRSRPSSAIFHAMVDRFRTMPKATIAKLEGRARGGGSEFVLSLDMRFAALGRAVLAQPEVALGIIPGGSGTQRLPRLWGGAERSRSSSGARISPPRPPSATATSIGRCRRPSSGRSSSVWHFGSRRFPARRSRSPRPPSTRRSCRSATGCSQKRTTSTRRSLPPPPSAA